MTLTLPADLQGFVEDKVAAGAYSSEEEVVRDAIQRMKGNDEEYARISEAIDVGWEQAKSGQLHSMDEVLAELEERKRRWEAKRAGQ